MMKFKTPILCWALIFATAAGSEAATMNWGDKAGTDVVFQQVTEDNDEPSTVFAPAATGPSVAGNTLVFAPVNFQSQANNGADLIDSTLTTKIVAKPGASIDSIAIDEFGDYTLGGLNDADALASVGAAFFWRVTEVNGVAISLPTQIAAMTFTGGGMYERPADDGTAVPWTGNVVLDVAAYLLGQGISGDATGVTLRFDNTLQTAADNFSNAFIKKKGVDITVTPGDPVIPEPTAAALLTVAAVTCCMRRR
jgi:hypothetical protein